MNLRNSNPQVIEESRYLIVMGGGSRETQNGGILIHNFADYCLLDLETMTWLPINFMDERLRSGCKGYTYYEGPSSGSANQSGAEAGWLMSGGIISHLLEPEEDATLVRDIYNLKLFQ